jgi:hypothetical protein
MMHRIDWVGTILSGSLGSHDTTAYLAAFRNATLMSLYIWQCVTAILRSLLHQRISSIIYDLIQTHPCHWRNWIYRWAAGAAAVDAGSCALLTVPKPRRDVVAKRAEVVSGALCPGHID